eukprot:g8875.t1
MEYKLQTPLMSSAATGNISIVGAVLAAFEELFVGDGDKRQSDRQREQEMKRQMKIVDVDDRTLLMHASCSGSSAMFNVISQEVQRKQLRKVLTRQDANGMNFLHHAINAKSDDKTDATQGQPPSPLELAPDEWEADPGFVVVANSGAEEPPTPIPSAELLDPWVPVVKSAFKFARASLWLAEYRRQLLIRDAWGRSAIEHALNSGRPQVVEVVFEAIRRDVYDEERALHLDGDDDGRHGRRRRSTLVGDHWGTAGLEYSEMPPQPSALEPRSTLGNSMEQRATRLQDQLKSAESPRSAIIKAFDGRKAAAAEALGSVDPRPEIEDCKAEAVEALQALDPRPVMREAIDEGRTSARGHLEALAAPIAGEVKKPIDTRSTMRDVLKEGEERTVEAVQDLAAAVAASGQDLDRST